jgi:hypothetical protein
VTPNPYEDYPITPERVYELFSRGWDTVRIAGWCQMTEAQIVDLLYQYRNRKHWDKRGG